MDITVVVGLSPKDLTTKVLGCSGKEFTYEYVVTAVTSVKEKYPGGRGQEGSMTTGCGSLCTKASKSITDSGTGLPTFSTGT